MAAYRSVWDATSCYWPATLMWDLFLPLYPLLVALSCRLFCFEKVVNADPFKILFHPEGEADSSFVNGSRVA